MTFALFEEINNTRIYNYDEYERITARIRDEVAITGRANFVEMYRGLSSINYKLTNGIGRVNLPQKLLFCREKYAVNTFWIWIKLGFLKDIQHMYSHRSAIHGNKWFHLFQAQHLGLKTRLMDWSQRPDIALMFAVGMDHSNLEDSCVWAIYCPREYIITDDNLELLFKDHPLRPSQNYMINCPGYVDNNDREHIGERRRRRQQGRFFIQPSDKCVIPLEDQPELKPFLVRLIIDGASKNLIRDQLENINQEWAYYRQNNSISRKIKFLNRFYSKSFGIFNGCKAR